MIPVAGSQMPGHVVAPGKTYQPSLKPTLMTGDKDTIIRGSSFRLQENDGSQSVRRGGAAAELQEN